MDKFTRINNVVSFIFDKKGSVLGIWSGRLTAKEQRELFGVFLGKGILEINGEEETIKHKVKVCFGLDSDVTKFLKFNDL